METLRLARDLVDKITPDKATEALSKVGGKVLKTSLTRDAEEQLQEALHCPDHRQGASLSSGQVVAPDDRLTALPIFPLHLLERPSHRRRFDASALVLVGLVEESH